MSLQSRKKIASGISHPCECSFWMFLLVYLPGKICCYYWLVLPLFRFLSNLQAILRLPFVEPGSSFAVWCLSKFIFIFRRDVSSLSCSCCLCGRAACTFFGSSGIFVLILLDISSSAGLYNRLLMEYFGSWVEHNMDPLQRTRDLWRCVQHVQLLRLLKHDQDC